MIAGFTPLGSDRAVATQMDGLVRAKTWGVSDSGLTRASERQPLSEPSASQAWSRVVAYTNMPSQMRLEQSSVVELRVTLQVGDEESWDSGPGKGMRGAKFVRVGGVTSADLQGDQEVFQIRALKPEEQRFSGDAISFRFEVKPRRTGTHQLTFVLTDTTGPAPLVVTRLTVPVRIVAGFGERWLFFAIRNWQFLVPLLIPLLVTLVLRVRRWVDDRRRPPGVPFERVLAQFELRRCFRRAAQRLRGAAATALRAAAEIVLPRGLMPPFLATAPARA